MESEKFIPFMVYFTGIFFLLDVYFVLKWARYCRLHKLKSPWLLSVLITAALMLCFALYHIYIQIGNLVPGKLEKALFTLKDIWYMPKALIVPVMIVSDIIGFASKKKDSGKYSLLSFILDGLRWPVFKIKRLFVPKPETRLNLGNGMTIESPAGDDGYFRENETVEPVEKNSEKRRKFLKTATWATATVPFGIVTKGVLDTTYDFRVHRANIPVAKSGRELDGLLIAQVSDLHAGSLNSPKPIRDAVSIINGYKPDVIFLTGDFVNFHPDEFDMISMELKQLKSSGIGIYGCLGNHDHFMSDKNLGRLKAKINASGINLLNNESEIFVTGSGGLNIAGIDNTGYGQNYGDFGKALGTKNHSYPTVLLVHDPTNWDQSIKSKTDVELMLSGHTHGGQMGLEVFGEIVTPARIKYKQFAGLYQYGDQYLYINRGLGTTGPPIRVGVNPEITLLTLRDKSGFSA